MLIRVGNAVRFSNPTLEFEATPEDEAQAQKNHWQTLTRLNERGGLTWCEFLAIIQHRPYKFMDIEIARLKVQEVLEGRAC